MEGLILIASCLLVGLLMGRMSGIPDSFSTSLATFAVRVSLPSLVLIHLHALPLETDILLPSAMPWLVFLLAAGAAWVAGTVFKLPPATVGCLTLMCGTGNTSIVGVPMVQAFVGDEAMGYALVADQSNFIVMSTLGMLVAAAYSPLQRSGHFALRRLATYPPILAMAAALLLKPFVFPPLLNQVLATLGDTLTPLAIVSVGASMKVSHLNGRLRLFLMGSGIKLLLAPAAIFGLYVLLAGETGMVVATSVLQAAMPPMIVAGLIASDWELDSQLAAMLVGLGIPLSFLTVSLWSLLCT